MDSDRFPVLREQMVRRTIICSTLAAALFPAFYVLIRVFFQGRSASLELIFAAVAISAVSALIYFLLMSGFFVVADRITRSGRIPTSWTRTPTARQWAGGIPLILAVGVAVGGLLILLL